MALAIATGYSMQRPLRLHRSADFMRMRQAGQTVRHPLFALSTAPNDLPYNRYGFIVGKKVGNAVKRNLVRRRVREALRRSHPKLKPGYDLVWIVRNECVTATYKQISDAVTVVLHRARLWMPE